MFETRSDRKGDLYSQSQSATSRRPPAFRTPRFETSPMKMTMEIATPLATAKGAKRAVITKGGEEYLWKSSERTRTPWAPSNLSDPGSNSLDYCFTPTPEIAEWVAAVEEEALAIVAKDPKTYLGSANLSPAVVQERFVSNMKTSARGAPNFKCRGRFGHLRFWDAKGQAIKDPTVFSSDCQYQFVVKVSSLWIGEKGFGLSFDLQHLMLHQDLACPFKT